MTSGEDMTDFSTNTSSPLYLQVYDYIKNDILEQKLKRGDRLPSEEELAKKYRISRMTLRKSLALLINDGFIYSQHGVGTFISKYPIQFPIQFDYTKVTSFSAQVKAQGHEIDSLVLSISEIPYNLEIYQGLHLKKTQSVICIKRLRIMDAVPFSIEQSFHPKDNYENFNITNQETDLKSIYAVMEKSGYHATREINLISATNATQEEADLLNISEGVALLSFKTITYSKQGIPLEFLKMVARPDRYQFTSVSPR
jgi:DNA-binding GntR family transcriptional regulator